MEDGIQNLLVSFIAHPFLFLLFNIFYFVMGAVECNMTFPSLGNWHVDFVVLGGGTLTSEIDLRVIDCINFICEVRAFLIIGVVCILIS